MSRKESCSETRSGLSVIQTIHFASHDPDKCVFGERRFSVNRKENCRANRESVKFSKVCGEKTTSS